MENKNIGSVIIGALGTIAVAIIYNWNSLFPHSNASTSPVIISPIQKPVMNTPTVRPAAFDYTKRIIYISELSEWSYITDDTISFSYKFKNISADQLACVVKFITGYCNSEKDCFSINGKSTWVEKENKNFSFIIPPFETYTLEGFIAQFPTEVSDDCRLRFEIVSAQQIQLN